MPGSVMFGSAGKSHRYAKPDSATKAKLDAGRDCTRARSISADEAEQVCAGPWAAAIAAHCHATADVRLPFVLMIRVERELAVTIQATAKARRAYTSTDCSTNAEIIAEWKGDPGARLERRRITPEYVETQSWNVRQVDTDLLSLGRRHICADR